MFKSDLIFEVLLWAWNFLFASHMSRNVISRRLARSGHSNFIHSRFIHVKIVRWEIISFNTPRIVSFLVGVYHVRQRYIVLRNGHALSEFSCLVPNSLWVSKPVAAKLVGMVGGRWRVRTVYIPYLPWRFKLVNASLSVKRSWRNYISKGRELNTTSWRTHVWHIYTLI